MGLTHFSQLHPGPKYALPILVSPTFAISTLPFSIERTSSGDFILFFCNLAFVAITSISVDLSIFPRLYTAGFDLLDEGVEFSSDFQNGFVYRHERITCLLKPEELINGSTSVTVTCD
jgi:hypothetical protein